MTGNGSFPLSRFKVLDLTRARAGPTAVRQLVDWGAEAIKIEMPGGRAGDGMGGNRHGFDFQNLHRNKKSITLNLKHPEAVEIFYRLVKNADVVVENYRPGAMDRLGLGYGPVVHPGDCDEGQFEPGARSRVRPVAQRGVRAG